LDFGDFEFAALNLESIYNYSYHAGVELTIINNEMKTCTDIIEKINQKTALFILKSYHEAVISLVEITDNPAEFKGKVYDENIILPALIESGSFSAIIIHYVLKVITYYLFYDYNKAIENSNKTMKNIDAIAGAFLLFVVSTGIMQ
jgi:predicted ATPase